MAFEIELNESPMFFAAVYYLVFNGILTVLLGRLEKKLDYFR